MASFLWIDPGLYQWSHSMHVHVRGLLYAYLFLHAGHVKPRAYFINLTNFYQAQKNHLNFVHLMLQAFSHHLQLTNMLKICDGFKFAGQYLCKIWPQWKLVIFTLLHNGVKPLGSRKLQLIFAKIKNVQVFKDRLLIKNQKILTQNCVKKRNCSRYCF